MYLAEMRPILDNQKIRIYSLHKSRLMRNSKPMNVDMGGKVADRLMDVHGLEYRCRCGNEIPLTKGPGSYIMGYPHDGGTPDSDGEKWWMYIDCTECDFEITLGKAEHELSDPLD